MSTCGEVHMMREGLAMGLKTAGPGAVATGELQPGENGCQHDRGIS